MYNLTVWESESDEAEMFLFGRKKVELNIPADQKLDWKCLRKIVFILVRLTFF